MRIAWLSSDPVVQGSIGVTDRIEGARYLTRAGHDVTVLCGARRGDDPFPDIATEPITARYLPFLTWASLWPALSARLDALDPTPDVVVSDFALLPPLMRWRRARRRIGERFPSVVLDVRSHPVEAGAVRIAAQRARFAVTLRRYGREVEGVSTISPELRDHVARWTRLPPDAIRLWSSGCAWCDAPPPPASHPPEMPQAPGRFVVLYHGMLTAGRGLFEALDGVDLARRSAPDLILVLLGDGGARPALERKAIDLGLEGHVRFLDPVPYDRVHELVRAADVGLAPWPATWDMEANRPLKLAEYLCLGLPVVITDIVPHRIVPSDAPFAFWASGASAEAFADALLRARAAREDLPSLGAAAREWARPRLGWSQQLAVLESAIEEAVERWGAPPRDRSARFAGG
jgi:glycosyltransferase involved in cell wall biosynthesis